MRRWVEALPGDGKLDERLPGRIGKRQLNEREAGRHGPESARKRCDAERCSMLAKSWPAMVQAFEINALTYVRWRLKQRSSTNCHMLCCKIVSGGVLHDSVNEEVSLEKGNDVLVAVEPSPTLLGGLSQLDVSYPGGCPRLESRTRRGSPSFKREGLNRIHRPPARPSANVECCGQDADSTLAPIGKQSNRNLLRFASRT